MNNRIILYKIINHKWQIWQLKSQLPQYFLDKYLYLQLWFFDSGSFETYMVSQIVDNQPRHFAAIQNILACAELGAIKKDCEIVHMVCDAVSRRAAYMCAAAVRLVYFIFWIKMTVNKKILLVAVRESVGGIWTHNTDLLISIS